MAVACVAGVIICGRVLHFIQAKSRKDWSENKSSLKLLRTHKKCDRNNFPASPSIVSTPAPPPATLVYIGVPPRQVRLFFLTLMRVASSEAKMCRRKIGFN